METKGGCVNRLCRTERTVVMMRLLEERAGEDVAVALGLRRGYVDVLLPSREGVASRVHDGAKLDLTERTSEAKRSEAKKGREARRVAGLIRLRSHPPPFPPSTTRSGATAARRRIHLGYARLTHDRRTVARVDGFRKVMLSSSKDVQKIFRAGGWTSQEEIQAFVQDTGKLPVSEVTKLLQVLLDRTLSVSAPTMHSGRCVAFSQLAEIAADPELFRPLVKALRASPDQTTTAMIVALLPKVNLVTAHRFDLCGGPCVARRGRPQGGGDGVEAGGREELRSSSCSTCARTPNSPGASRRWTFSSPRLVTTRFRSSRRS